MSLTGKVALVTGAARRVGRAVALGLATSGAQVIVHYHRSSSEIDSLMNELARLGADPFSLAADLADPAEIEHLAGTVHQRFGPLDILVNNASVFRRTPIATLDERHWDGMMNVNLRAPFLCSLRFGRRMKAAGRGRIINIADAAALRPSPDYLPYCVSKAALLALTQGMARALAPEVQVTCVAPGVVLPPEGVGPETLEKMTQSIPLLRVGTPQDVSEAVIFLATRGDFITGATIFVDGGWLTG